MAPRQDDFLDLRLASRLTPGPVYRPASRYISQVSSDLKGNHSPFGLATEVARNRHDPLADAASRWRTVHRPGTRRPGGRIAGRLAPGAYLAHRLGGSGRVAALVRRTRSRAGSVARELEAEAGEIDTRDLEDEDQDYAVDDILDDESGDDWDDENDEDDDDGDAYDDDDAFSSADPDLEERVLEAFTNDPILSERAVDIGAIRASTIELVGTVFSDEELDYATTLTGGVPGVEKVVNRLVVREPTDAKGTTHRSAPPADRATGGRTDDGPTAATGDAEESRPPESPPAH